MSKNNIFLKDWKEYRYGGNGETYFDGLMKFNSDGVGRDYSLKRADWPAILGGLGNHALGWEAAYFSCLHNFWDYFSAGLVISNGSKVGTFIERKPKLKLVNNNPVWDTYFGFAYVYKQLEGRYLKYVEKTRKEFPEFERVAELTFSMANILPCPDHGFKRANDFIYFDEYIPSFTGFMKSIQEEPFAFYKMAEVGKDELNAWIKNLKENREKYLLEDYYDMEGDIFVPKELFPGEFETKYGYPTTEDEMHICLGEIIRRIENRGERMEERWRELCL